MRCFFSVLAIFATLTLSVLAQRGPIPPFDPFGLPSHRGWMNAIESGTRLAHGAPGPKSWRNHAQYELEVSLDPAEARLTGQGRFRYQNNSPREMRQLLLHLRQNLHREGVRRTRQVEITGGVEISSVKLGGVKVKPGWRRGFSIRGSLLRVNLEQPLASGAEVELELAWSFRVPRAGFAPRNGHEDHRVFYLAYWYPQFAVFDDVEGWVADQYLGNGEFYMGYADYDIRFRAPPGFLVRSTGELQNPEEVLHPQVIERLAQVKGSDDIVRIVEAEDLEKAKVTATTQGKELSWNFRALNVRDVAVSISDRYLWDATRAQTGGNDAEPRYCTVHAVYEENAKFWRGAAAYSRATIEFMSREVAPYPWPHMTACEGIIGGGMEFPMMTIVGSNSLRGTRGTVAHEIIHMWFPMIVGQNEKRYAWMDEGMTSFFTSRVVASIVRAQKEKLDAQEFLRAEVEPKNKRARLRGYLRSAGRDFEEPCMRHADRYDMYSGAFRFASYTKTAAVLHQLRCLVGTEVFDRALSAYVRDWAMNHPYPEDFFARLSHETGQDLSWYFRTWFFETWTLDQAITSLSRDGDRSQIRIENLGQAPSPTRIEVELKDGRILKREVSVEWWLKGHRAATVEVIGSIRQVRIDPESITLDTNVKNNVWPRPEPEGPKKPSSPEAK